MRMLILMCLILGLTQCVSAEFGAVSAKANTVQIGFTKDQVESIMGTPQFYETNPNNGDIAYAHYCIYGIVTDDDNGFFYYRDEVYRKITNIGRNPNSEVWEDFSRRGGLNCFYTVDVNWSATQTPPKLISERRAIEQNSRAIERQKKETQRRRELELTTREYFIDGLVITHTEDAGTACFKGSDYRIDVRGSIGPDSSFALDELLRRSPNCLGENGEIKSRTTVELESLGGLLNDGYLMGRAFRTHGVKTMITSDSACASSCAVAYLGGVDRIMETDSLIMFHSPYLPGLNSQGERVANCDVGSETTTELLEYYQEMTSAEQGERLFDRTISYCSAEDGWVLKGSAAAELYGVATEI